MILRFAFVLCLASMGMEGLLVYRVKPFYRIMVRFPTFNIVFSFFFSYGIARMFGASGLIAMTAAIGSTALAVPMYRLIGWLHSHPDAIADNREKVRAITHEAAEIASDLLRLIIFLLRCVTLPFRVYRQTSNFINSSRERQRAALQKGS